VYHGSQYMKCQELVLLLHHNCDLNLRGLVL